MYPDLKTEYLIKKLKESGFFAVCPDLQEQFRLSEAALFDGTKPFPEDALEVQQTLQQELTDREAELGKKRMLTRHYHRKRFRTTLRRLQIKNRQKNLASTKTLLGRLVMLKMGVASAQNAGRICAELEREGHPIGLRDAMIGAITLTKGYSLTTGNTEHFKKIRGLSLIPIP